MSRHISPGGTLVGAMDFSYRSQGNGVLSYPTHKPMALEATRGRTPRGEKSRMPSAGLRAGVRGPGQGWAFLWYEEIGPLPAARAA